MPLDRVAFLRPLSLRDVIATYGPRDAERNSVNISKRIEFFSPYNGVVARIQRPMPRF